MLKWVDLKIIDPNHCRVTLEDGSEYYGYIIHSKDEKSYWGFNNHIDSCKKLFLDTNNQSDLEYLSKRLGMELVYGYCPYSKDPVLFIKRYYERIGSQPKSGKIYIEKEFDIKPKFKL
jgi:hypothetical protein